MNKCLECGDDTKTKFCSSSCAATYNNKHNHWRAKHGVLNGKTCKQCSNQINFRNKGFCSNTCSIIWKWNNEVAPKIESGTISNPHQLKRYLVEQRGNKCSECDNPPTWKNKPLTLQLDHIDGNSDNNMPSNLRLMCPNCHTQTETFGSKGMGNRYKKITKRNSWLRDYKSN